MEALIYQPHRVDLPGGLPPGHYQVWLRLLEKESHQPVALRTGEVEALVVPDLVVQTATGNRAAQLPPHTPLSVDWGEIMLGGYHLEDVIYRPGHVMNVNMYWQAQGSIEQDYEWVIQLLDPTGQLSAETITTPTRADYPPTQWQQGEWLQGQATVVIPPLAYEGEYTVQVGLHDPQTGRFLRSRWFGPPFVTLGRVRVAPWPLQTTFPPIPMPLAVTIGKPVFADLAGYALTTTAISPTTPLSMTLFWQAQREIDASYAVFIHLIDEQGRIVAQRDSLPVRGSRPTTSWRTGEVLLDQHDLSVGTEVAMGEYQLWVGLYDPNSGERPVTVENGITLPEGRIFLGHITVK
jgi:hypothetical protein